MKKRTGCQVDEVLLIKNDEGRPIAINVIVGNIPENIPSEEKEKKFFFSYMDPLLRALDVANILKVGMELEIYFTEAKGGIFFPLDPAIIEIMAQKGYISKIDSVIRAQEVRLAIKQNQPPKQRLSDAERSRRRRVIKNATLFTSEDYNGLVQTYPRQGKMSLINSKDQYISINLMADVSDASASMIRYLETRCEKVTLLFNAERREEIIVGLPLNPEIPGILREGGYLTKDKARVLAFRINQALEENQRLGRGLH